MLHAPTETKINKQNIEKEFINLARPVLDGYFLSLTSAQTSAFLWDLFITAQGSEIIEEFDSTDRVNFAHHLRLVMGLVSELEGLHNTLNGIAPVQDPQTKDLQPLTAR